MTWYDTRAVLDLDETQQSDKALDDMLELLLGSMRATERDLGAKTRTLPDGTVMSAEQYRQWRGKAIKSMDFRTEKYRKCKLERQRRRTQAYAASQISASATTAQ